MESRQGTARAPDPSAAWGLVESKLFPDLTVIDFSRKAALLAADIDAALERRGRTLPAVHLMFGASALMHGLILVTRSVRDFTDIPGLAVENGFQEAKS
jgi:predicted nucleic acid-binding protein